MHLYPAVTVRHYPAASMAHGILGWQVRRQHDSSSLHSRGQRDRSAVDDEAALAEVMQGARAFTRRVDPGLEHFEHEEIVPRRHAGVGDAALEAGVTLVDQRWRDLPGRPRREAKGGELVEAPA